MVELHVKYRQCLKNDITYLYGSDGAAEARLIE